LHVALSRGTRANHLYYTGEPPAHEDHHLPAAGKQPALENLVAAAGRSRAQVMALDLLQAARTTISASDLAAARARRQQRLEWAAASSADRPHGADSVPADARRPGRQGGR
jgi:hypothetical protein